MALRVLGSSQASRAAWKEELNHSQFNRYPFFILESLVILGFAHVYTLVDLRCCNSDLIPPCTNDLFYH